MSAFDLIKQYRSAALRKAERSSKTGKAAPF